MNKGWKQCSIRERRLIDLLLQKIKYEKISQITGYTKTSIARLKKQLNEAIAERMAMMDTQRVAKVEQVLSGITDIALGTVQEQIISQGILMDKELSAKDRLKALELLGKYHALFVEKVEVKEDKKIKIEIIDIAEE